LKCYVRQFSRKEQTIWRNLILPFCEEKILYFAATTLFLSSLKEEEPTIGILSILDHSCFSCHCQGTYCFCFQSSMQTQIMYTYFLKTIKKPTERETGYSEMAFIDTGKGMRV